MVPSPPASTCALQWGVGCESKVVLPQRQTCSLGMDFFILFCVLFLVAGQLSKFAIASRAVLKEEGPMGPLLEASERGMTLGNLSHTDH